MRLTRTGLYGASAVAGMVAYFMLLILPKAGERMDWRESPDLTLYQTLGAALFIALNFAWTRRGVANNDMLRTSAVTDKLMLAFFAFALFGATLSVLPLRTVQYVIVTFLVFAAATHVWRIPDEWRRGAFGFLLVGINVFCFANLYVFGIGTGRYVGQMSPNHFADILITGLMLGYLSGWRRVWLFVAPTYWCIWAVGSRGSFGALTVFLLVFYGLRWAAKPLSRKVRVGYFGLAAVGALIVYTLYDSSWLGSEHLTSFVAWNEVGRDISNLSGRIHLWDEALERVRENLLLGYGFRTSMELINSHNAFLNLATEVGVPATLLFVFVVFGEGLRKMRLSFRSDACEPWVLDEARVITGIIAAVLVNAIVEVHLVNVGFPLPLLFIIALSDRRFEHVRKRRGAEPAYAQGARAPELVPAAPALGSFSMGVAGIGR
jgi:hypothetical protein